MLKPRALAYATVIGTVLQVAMVTTGHSNKTIASFYALGGMGFSLIAGLLYTWMSHSASTSNAAIGGVVAGGVCAVLGILVAYLLGDVPASLLVLGTASSIVTGALGGWLGRFLARGSVGAGGM
jgi:hypothetical protein